MMNKELLFNKGFHLSSLITDKFPRTGGKFLDITLKGILGNKRLFDSLEKRAHKSLKSVNNFDHILVASDLNIGDAVITQAGISFLRKLFPVAEIDYVIKRSAKILIEGNPEVSNLYPVYEGAPYPEDDDLRKLSAIAQGKPYGLVISFSPMIEDAVFGDRKVINYVSMAAKLVRNEKTGEGINNVVYQAYRFVRDVFEDSFPMNDDDIYRGVGVYLSDVAVELAQEFLSNFNHGDGERIVFFNPDASSDFTRIPFAQQIDLLKKLARKQCTILLGSGHVKKFIEYRLVGSLSRDEKKNVIIVPASTPLDMYAALIDSADVFISGDTGPLHISAAKKFQKNSGQSLRNKTAIYSVFGSTPPRIYGYDSEKPGFFPANQDAPSRIFIAESPCRNITCINKMAKTCKEVRCFQSLDIDGIVARVMNDLENVKSFRDSEQVEILAK